jgi:hypothetical protein
MQTLTMKARSGKDGVVRLEIPTDKADHNLEIVVVMRTIEDEPLDAMGYPIGYFEETYGSFADHPLERNQPSLPDSRDAFE